MARHAKTPNAYVHTVREWLDDHRGISRGEAVERCARELCISEKSVLRKWKELYGCRVDQN